MKVTVADLIKQLSERDPKGVVFLKDPDTGWLLTPRIEDGYEAGETYITADYHGDKS